mgnify:CR=1 FL=1
MYDILAHPVEQYPNTINKEGLSVVTNPELLLKAHENVMQHLERQRKMEEQDADRKAAKAEALLQVGSNIREGEQEHFAQRQNELYNLAHDLMPDIKSSNKNKSDAALLQLQQKAKQVTDEIKYANNYAIGERAMNNYVTRNGDHIFQFSKDKLSDNAKRSLFDKENPALPLVDLEPEIGLKMQEEFQKNYPNLAQGAKIKPQTTKDEFGNYRFETTQELTPEEKKAILKQFLLNPIYQRQFEHQIEDTKQKDYYANPETKQIDFDSLMKRAEETIHFPSVVKQTVKEPQGKSSGTASFAQITPVNKQYDPNTEETTYTVQESPDSKAINVPVGNRSYDLTGVSYTKDKNGNILRGVGTKQKEGNYQEDFTKWKEEYDKAFSDWKRKNSLVKEGKDSEGKKIAKEDLPTVGKIIMEKAQDKLNEIKIKEPKANDPKYFTQVPLTPTQVKIYFSSRTKANPELGDNQQGIKIIPLSDVELKNSVPSPSEKVYIITSGKNKGKTVTQSQVDKYKIPTSQLQENK